MRSFVAKGRRREGEWKEKGILQTLGTTTTYIPPRSDELALCCWGANYITRTLSIYLKGGGTTTNNNIYYYIKLIIIYHQQRNKHQANQVVSTGPQLPARTLHIYIYI